MKKNEEYVVDIIDSGYEGEGIAKIEDFTIFVKDALEGEKCTIQILKVTSSYAFARVIQIIKESEHRVEPDCATYKRCGGCNLRHIDYNETLDMKRRMVENLVRKSLGNDIRVLPTLGMGNPYNYRNKVQFPVGVDKLNNPVIGVFANRTHEIIPVKNCLIQNTYSEQIAKYIIEYVKDNNISIYNEETGKGILRHIVIKIGIQTNEVMVVLVINGREFTGERRLAESIVKRFPNVKTVVKNINMKNTNVILGKENDVIVGDGFIYDILGEYKFKISPLSFYQVNPVQAEALYYTALESASLKKDDVLYDLYCGIGTIGIFASGFVKKVYGIEIVEEAIRDAWENARLNNIENIEFFAGDVEVVFADIVNQKKDVPNVVVVDPPRKGLDRNTINSLKVMKPEKIIYISCNPATMVRDMALLGDSYGADEVQPVDMFPFTNHVECVAVMGRREG
ncbi:MAG: 23S rRNA (uracil(1939)-C(5))-methyltransferase RlmD [Bacilli bacterium]|nr:23S rRNA (uracil(1939)-C(5))-methyltransferase RlmD [Bacilli bacterium]